MFFVRRHRWTTAKKHGKVGGSKQHSSQPASENLREVFHETFFQGIEDIYYGKVCVLISGILIEKSGMLIEKGSMNECLQKCLSAMSWQQIVFYIVVQRQKMRVALI